MLWFFTSDENVDLLILNKHKGKSLLIFNHYN